VHDDDPLGQVTQALPQSLAAVQVLANWQHERQARSVQRPLIEHQVWPAGQVAGHDGNEYEHWPLTQLTRGQAVVPPGQSSHGAPGRGQSADVVQLVPAAAAGDWRAATTKSNTTDAASNRRDSRLHRSIADHHSAARGERPYQVANVFVNTAVLAGYSDFHDEDANPVGLTATP